MKVSEKDKGVREARTAEGGGKRGRERAERGVRGRGGEGGGYAESGWRRGWRVEEGRWRRGGR